MPISSAAMLVELNISVWTANKVDKAATRKVADDNHASSDSGLFRKNLMAGSYLRKEIADYAASCRLWHNMRTLPWADRGPRLLATSMFFDYKKDANARSDYFMAKRDQFVQRYPELKATAQANLGDMFDPTDYPDVSEVAAKFDFRLVFSPVPESGDFRLDLPKEELVAMRSQYDDAFNARLADAMREPWERLHEMLTGMTKKLTEGDEETKKRWHDTFLTNAQDLCQMLAHLNITKDANLEQARLDVQRAISGVDLDAIKESAAARADVKAKLDAVLKNYNW